MNELSENHGVISPVTSAQPIFDNIDHAPFSSKGFELLNDRITSYIDDLVGEASKVSKRYRADTISAVHVEKAAEHLATGSGLRAVRHAGTIGGILLGAGLSTVLSMVSTNTITVIGLLTACSFSVAGAFLVALHIAKD